MTLLQILLVIDVTAGVVLGIVHLLTLWEARRRTIVPALGLVPFVPSIVAPASSREAEQAPKAEPATMGQLDLAVPVASMVQLDLATLPESTDEEEEPEPDPETCAEIRDEWSGFPWYDASTCWGCDKACKASRFHPYRGSNIGAEIRGACASRARVRAEEPYAVDASHANHAQVGREPSTSVASLWSSTCEACGRLVRRVQAGLEPVRSAVVATADAEPCPF